MPDINRVLRIYLGADEHGGYEPLYRDERMRQAFPDSYPQMIELIARYLEEDPEPRRFDRNSLNSIRPLFEPWPTAGTSGGVVEGVGR